jgi:hypothetical protein
MNYHNLVRRDFLKLEFFKFMMLHRIYVGAWDTERCTWMIMVNESNSQGYSFQFRMQSFSKNRAQRIQHTQMYIYISTSLLTNFL